MKINIKQIMVVQHELELPVLKPIPCEYETIDNHLFLNLEDENGNQARVDSDLVLPKYNWETVKQYKTRLRHYLYSLYENNMKVVLFCPPEEL
jgi:hypothetical protein